MKKAVSFLVLFSLLFCGTLQAQTETLLKSVTVNPSPLDIKTVKSGRSITVITAKEISKMAATSVEEVLSNIEGINSNARGGFGVQTDVGLRGSTFSQVLVLIDNVRVNESLTGHYNMYLPIALSEIAKIEIVRGPAASAYGADAVGGLIHIQTKNYLSSANQKNKELGSVGQLMLGENKLRIVDAVLESKSKDLYFGGSVNNKSSLGQIFNNPNVLRDSSLEKNYRTDFDIQNYSLFGSYFLNNRTKIFARASLNTRKFNARYFYTNSTFDESVEKVNTVWTQAGLQHHGKKQKSQLGIAFKQLGDEFIFNPLFAVNHHTTRNVVAYAQQQRTLGRHFQVAFGWQSIFQNIQSTDRGDHQNNTHALFMSANYDVCSKLNITASARGEYNTDFDFSFVPQIGVAFRPRENMVLRSSVGMANRAPDFTERYVSNNLPSLSAGRNLGNPNLQSERSTTADIGFDYYSRTEKLFSSTVFARQGSNLIDYTLTNSNLISSNVELVPNADYFYTKNVSSAMTYGAEVSVQKRVRISKNRKLRLGINYTYLKTTTTDDEPSKYISNHPGQMANALIGYEGRFVDVLITNQWRQRKSEIEEAVFGEIPKQYLISNAVLRLKTFNGKMNLTGKVLNIFDTEYQEILGAPMPQRWFAAGIDWKF
jgi:iron complex outermembrane receptor protein